MSPKTPPQAVRKAPAQTIPGRAPAFDSLEARADAAARAAPAAAAGPAGVPSPAPEQPRDRISLRDHVVSVEIGAFQRERGTTQRVAFDVVVEVSRPASPPDDDVDRILSYDTITAAIAQELAAERLNLLETLAERIAARILRAPRAQRVFLRIQKLDRGPGALGVKIVRARPPGQSPGPAKPPTARPRPLLVHLANAAIVSPHLSGWLDQLAALNRPSILCVGPPDRPAPFSPEPAVRRRIELLAMEQNAWVLAGRDRRCMVVNSRTELDWGMGHGQLSVWAPGKIVLDAADPPAAIGPGGSALVHWFAGLIGARHLLRIASTPEPPPPISHTRMSPTAPRLPQSLTGAARG